MLLLRRTERQNYLTARRTQLSQGEYEPVPFESRISLPCKSNGANGALLTRLSLASASRRMFVENCRERGRVGHRTKEGKIIGAIRCIGVIGLGKGVAAMLNRSEPGRLSRRVVQNEFPRGFTRF